MGACQACGGQKQCELDARPEPSSDQPVLDFIAALANAMEQVGALEEKLPLKSVGLKPIVEGMLQAKPELKARDEGVEMSALAAALTQVLRDLNLPLKSADDVMDLCELLDVNGDSSISFYELASMLPFVCGEGSSQQENDEVLFKLMDENGDGQLTQAEFAQFLQPVTLWLSMLAKLPRAEVPQLSDKLSRQVIEKMDIDKDQRIAASEWHQWSTTNNFCKCLEGLFIDHIRSGYKHCGPHAASAQAKDSCGTRASENSRGGTRGGA